MRLEGFLSLIACVLLLAAMLYGLDALHAHFRRGVAPGVAESSSPP